MIGFAYKMEDDNQHVEVSPNVTPGVEHVIEKVPDTDDQHTPPSTHVADYEMREVANNPIKDETEMLT